MEERKVINLLAPGVDEEEMAKKADLVDGKVPASQLPSYVDDVVEYAAVAEFPDLGEQGKIYVALDSGFTYRWSGSEYIQIGGQDLSDYYTKSEADQLLATKQPVGDYATNTALEEGLAEKQDVGDYATNTALTEGLATKQDVGDYATSAELTAGLATKQNVGDYATNTALTEGLATKQPVGDYATNTALTEGLATKQPVGDYATNTALTEGLATKQDVIADLDAIRAGAAAGATAVQPDETTDVEVSEDQVADAPLLGSITIDDNPYNLPKKTSDLQNDAGFITDEDTTDLEMLEDQVTGAPFLGSITIDDNAYNLPKKVSDLQNDSDYATNSALETGLAGKQDVGDYATNTALTEGLATKQDVGDYATNAALEAGLATKQSVGDYATNTALTSGLATKQNTLVSGTNIKTINGDSVLGAGDLVVVPTEATELEIRRLFRTEYLITTSIINGTYSGDDSIWTEETATVNLAADSGYILPETVDVSGAIYTYDNITGAVALSDVIGNVSISAECPLPKLVTPVISIDNNTLSVSNIQGADQLQVYDDDTLVGSLTPPPSKGDIIKFDAMGDGNLKRFRVFSVDGNIAYLLSMTDHLYQTYFANDSQTYYYVDSLVDQYCNETYFNQLSTDVQNAIIDTDIQQDGWYERYYADELQDHSQYIETIRVEDSRIEGRNWQEIVQNIGSRHCFAPSIQDLFDYIGAVNGDSVSMSNLVSMLPDGYHHSMWLRNVSKYRYDSSWKVNIARLSSYYMGERIGVEATPQVHDSYNLRSVYPAFRIDLTKIIWQKEAA